MFICFIQITAFGTTLEGGITYTEETARVEAFRNALMYCPFENTRDFDRSLYVASIETSNILRMEEFHARIFNVMPFKVIGIQYKDNPNYVYYYKKQGAGFQCLTVDVIKQEPNNIVKAYKYNATVFILWQ